KLYRSTREDVPAEPYRLELGRARVVREGDALTLVAYGGMVEVCLQAAAVAAREGVELEVVDVETLVPFDEATVLGSVRKTGRAVVVHEAARTAGFGAEIAARIAEGAFFDLLAPVARVTGWDAPYPPFTSVEHHYRPDAARVLAAVREALLAWAAAAKGGRAPRSRGPGCPVPGPRAASPHVARGARREARGSRLGPSASRPAAVAPPRPQPLLVKVTVRRPARRLKGRRLVVEKDKAQALNTAVSQIERQFGKGAIMRLGAEPAQVLGQGVISTGSLSVDLALGVGGVPRGRIVAVYGPESGGKTTLALHVVAEAQRAGGVAAFVDAEHALDPVYAAALGVDVNELLVSQPDTGEQALEIVELLVRSGAVDVVVVDSVAALVPRAEIEGEMG